jgi:hypothetical protein
MRFSHSEHDVAVVGDSLLACWVFATVHLFFFRTIFSSAQYSAAPPFPVSTHYSIIRNCSASA